MKTRSGFVSNSSSSSFTTVLTKVDHEAILAEMDEKLADIMRKYVEEGKIGDLEVVGYGDMSGHGGETSYSGDIGWTEEMNVDSEDFDAATEAYGNLRLKKGIQTFGLSFDG